MPGELDGEMIGDLGTAALTARAVEPAQGEATGHDRDGSDCLNCGTALAGAYCHHCGQKGHVHKSLGAFAHDLLHGVFHFEGKIWRTLPLLAWHPGRLTREYINGRRASYVSPIALFLFVVFLTFAVFNLIGSPVQFSHQGENVGFGEGIAAARAQAQRDVVQLETRLAAARAGKGGDIASLERDLASARQALTAISAAQQGQLPTTIAMGDGGSGQTFAAAINRAWQHARANPQLTIYKLQNSAYKYSWLLIPLSLPFMWLLFPFSRRFGAYDHTVFVTYSLSFMLLLVALISVLMVWGGSSWLVLAVMGYAPFHMYRQLRDAYGLTRPGAWWRTWLLAVFAVLAGLLFAAALTILVTA